MLLVNREDKKKTKSDKTLSLHFLQSLKLHTFSKHHYKTYTLKKVSVLLLHITH